MTQARPECLVLENEDSKVEVKKRSPHSGEEPKNFVMTERIETLLTNMIMDHASGRDLFLVFKYFFHPCFEQFLTVNQTGPKGSGKTVVVKKFAAMLGYKIYPLLLYKDMAVRDLLQTRY